MSELDARYERGQETRRMFGGGQITGGSSPGAWDIAPDLERILGEGLFGTIWRRPALTPVQREMITLSSLIVLNREVQLRRHLGNALNIGLTPEQIVELIIHDTWYSGAPGGIQALTICREVFEERGIDFTPARIHDANEDPDSLFQRGDEYRRNYMGGGGGRAAPPTQAEAELGRITGEYYWGATWTRPGLDLPSRCICTMTCLATLGQRGAAAEPHPGRAEHRLDAGPDYRGVRAHDAVLGHPVCAGRDGRGKRHFCQRVERLTDSRFWKSSESGFAGFRDFQD